MRTGLVLAGGGAKGAYQIGAWQALREAHIEFDTIAGSSIGALNAALIASGDFEKARSFWSALSTFQLVRIEPLLLVGLLLRLLSSLTPQSRRSKIHSAEFLRTIIKYEAIMVVGFTFLVTLVAIFMSVPSPVMLSVGASTFACLVLVMLLPDVAELINGGLISQNVLSRLVDGNVDWVKIASGRTTIFVTIARIARRRRQRKLTATIPDYVALSKLETSMARDCVTASMALPFGIFPRIEILGQRYMDGGVADNIPIYPVLLDQCKVIYVVHLSPKPHYGDLNLLSDEQLERAMNLIDHRRQSTGEPPVYGRNWFQRRLEMGLAMKEMLLSPDEILAKLKADFNRPGDGHVKIVHIVPQQRLGRGLSGTLFFNYTKTERLMKLGYEDAKATLAGLRPLPPLPADWREKLEQRSAHISILILVIQGLVILGLLLLTNYFKSH